MLSLANMIPQSLLTDASKISDAGVVAGAAYNPGTSKQQSLVWYLATYDSGSCDTYYIFESSDAEGEAFDVSNEAPACVVGWAATSGGIRGYYWVVGDTSRTILSPLNGDTKSSARGVAVTGSGRAYAGVSYSGSLSSGCANHVSWDGIRWSSLSSGLTLCEDGCASTPDYDLWQAESNAVNADGMSAGHYFDPATYSCQERAVFWDPSGVAEDLNSSPLTSSSLSKVNAMTDADANGGVILVGEDSAGQHAIVWWRHDDGDPFTPIRSVDLNVRSCGWDLVAFNDVNSKGWIVGVGIHDNGHPRAVLLVPDPCPGDVNGDQLIDASDLGLVLGGWGACSGCCPADCDESGAVDATDLGIVLGGWGGCSVCSSLESMATQDPSSSGLSESLALALEIYGFDDVPSFAAWLETLSPSTRMNVLETVAAILSGGES